MAGDNAKFLVDMEKFVSKSNVAINTVRAFMAYELFSRVVDRTPVYFKWEKTSGTTKYNWQCTLNTPSTKVLKGTDKKGTRTKQRILKVLERVTADEDIYFANSVPWVWNLESGLYPKSPVRGSYNKKTKKYEIRSTGGYSKQQPSVGMVKLSLTEVPQIRAQALRKAKALDA